LGTKAKVREKVGRFFSGLCKRTAEVKQRFRTVLQAEADQIAKRDDNAIDLTASGATSLV
jgi:hypothetical protein